MDAQVKIDTHYTRSINLERDIESDDILKAYIPTSKALTVLEKITHTFSEQSMPRAWSLIGPYGSGKSSFAMFLTHLLEDQENQTCETAENLLTQHHPQLAKTLIEHTSGSSAYCTVVLTGSNESLSQRFVHALAEGAQNYWADKDLKPDIISTLSRTAKTGATVSEIRTLLDQLKQSVLESEGRGILIVIDELGKFLEYEARHQGANDIFLLQALAEYAYTGGQAHVLLVVLMHQAFEQYSKGLTESLRNEWLKVQGRFESIPFLETAEQTLRVVAAAFKSQLNSTQKKHIQQHTRTLVDTLHQQNALPVSLAPDIASEILARCYPLHPVAALLLPVLCQKVAQNERTLFSYLGSQEHYGFQDGLKRLQQFGDWVLPWEIFEYFILNQPSMTSDHATHRRWTEVLIALERLGDAADNEIKLLKTIGLFNIIGAQGGFKASLEILHCCFPNPDTVQPALNALQKKSIITFRKFSSEYRIWEGSDFDLETELTQTKQQLGRLPLADVLNKRQPLLPIVARRYSIETGSVRYFQPRYASPESLFEIHADPQNPQLIFFLADNQEAVKQFNTIAANTDALTLMALCDNIAPLNNALLEVIALEKILTENPLIKSDPVAQRELKDQLTAARQQENQCLNQILEQPGQNRWMWQGQPLNIDNKKHLQHQLSHILHTVYAQAPIIKNELVNRNKTSAQANSARNKLVAALLQNAHRDDLGFETSKYPPEKSIYRALFKETGIHREIQGVWQIAEPLQDNPYRLFYTWQAIDQFLQSHTTAQPLTAIYTLLSQPPYGIKQGLLPLLFMAYYLSKQRTLALYEEGSFCSHVTREHFEILLRRPELFSVESFEFFGIRAELFNQYLEKLVGRTPEQSTLLDIVKPLARFIKDLPQFTQTTRDLDPKALAVREAFSKTQSPVQLLFTELPEACGFKAYSDEQDFNNSPTEFLTVLVECLNLLNRAYPDLLHTFQQQLSQAFNLKPDLPLDNLRITLTSRYQGLENYTVDGQGLKAFILRLQNDKETDTAWLESVAAFLGKAPPDKWKAQNITQADYRLQEFSERLQALATVHNEQIKLGVDTQATLIRMVSEQGEYNEVAYLTDDLKNQANAKIAELKLNKTDKALKQAILASLMAELAEN